MFSKIRKILGKIASTILLSIVYLFGMAWVKTILVTFRKDVFRMDKKLGRGSSYFVPYEQKALHEDNYLAEF